MTLEMIDTILVGLFVVVLGGGTAIGGALGLSLIVYYAVMDFKRLRRNPERRRTTPE